MKIKSYLIAFVLAVIFIALGGFIVCFGFQENASMFSMVPSNYWDAPQSYSPEGMDSYVNNMENGYFVRSLPTYGIMFGVPIFLLGLTCLWLGFVLRGLEKRMKKLEEGKNNV